MKFTGLSVASWNCCRVSAADQEDAILEAFSVLGSHTIICFQEAENIEILEYDRFSIFGEGSNTCKFAVPRSHTQVVEGILSLKGSLVLLKTSLKVDIFNCYLPDSWKPLNDYVHSLTELTQVVQEHRNLAPHRLPIVSGDFQNPITANIPNVTGTAAKPLLTTTELERQEVLLKFLTTFNFKAANTFSNILQGGDAYTYRVTNGGRTNILDYVCVPSQINTRGGVMNSRRLWRSDHYPTWATLYGVNGKGYYGNNQGRKKGKGTNCRLGTSEPGGGS